MSQPRTDAPAPPPAIEIDGSKGEGGGQMFRLSVGLSAVTGLPVLNHSVRANRPKPGLALQHVACVKAVQVLPPTYILTYLPFPVFVPEVFFAFHRWQLLCEASVDGAALKSPRVHFVPARISGGDFRL
jgi:RNA 3'-terminal phosphate cyclase